MLVTFFFRILHQKKLFLSLFVNIYFVCYLFPVIVDILFVIVYFLCSLKVANFLNIKLLKKVFDLVATIRRQIFGRGDKFLGTDRTTKQQKWRLKDTLHFFYTEKRNLRFV